MHGRTRRDLGLVWVLFDFLKMGKLGKRGTSKKHDFSDFAFIFQILHSPNENVFLIGSRHTSLFVSLQYSYRYLDNPKSARIKLQEPSQFDVFL